MKTLYLTLLLTCTGCGSTNNIKYQADEYAKTQACKTALAASQCDSTKSCLVQVRHKGGMLTCRR